MMLSLIITGLGSVKIANFDVYLELVVEELEELWKGVKGLDVLQVQGRCKFNLKAMLIWTIHNFLGYDLVFGCQHQGYKTCLPYGPCVVSKWSKELGMSIFEGSQRWL